ncbi:hypothetical protein MRX96_007169 [Rhipicephalus microplus]
MTLPWALDPFSHHNLSTPFVFTSMTEEPGTPIPDASTRRQSVAAATHSSAKSTSRNHLICFLCGGRGHYRRRCLATRETTKAGDGERMPITSQRATTPGVLSLYAGPGKPTVTAT